MQGSVRNRRLGRRTAAGAMLVPVLLVTLGACSAALGSGTNPAPAPSTTTATPTRTPTAAAAAVTITPSKDSFGKVFTNAPISFSVTGGALDGVEVTGPGQQPVSGTTDLAKGTWTPDHPLALHASYQVTAYARNLDGVVADRRLDFTTINPDRTVKIQSITPYGGSKVGNAAPIVVIFDYPVTNQAEVAKLLKVTDTANTPGAWRWLTSQRVDYRPKTYWPVGDKVTVTANIEGASIAPHVWGLGSSSSTFTVNSAMRAVADLSTLRMTVYDGNKVLRTMPFGAGKPGFDTWGGSMVVLGKAPTTRMTSCSIKLTCDPKNPNYYDELITSTVQLTWSGTYIHSAPWDGLIGRANTSHGCIHLRPADAQWFYGLAEAGNLVTVTHAKQEVAINNGSGDWNLTWEQWTAPQKTVTAR